MCGIYSGAGRGRQCKGNLSFFHGNSKERIYKVCRLLDGFPLGYLKSQHKYFSSSLLMLLHSKAINLLLSDAGSHMFSLTKPLPTFPGIQDHGVLKGGPRTGVSFFIATPSN